jgi:transposase-like protein
MDEDTRYILASQVTKWGRTDDHAISLFRTAKARSRVRPKAIVTDGLPAYNTGVRRNFYRSSDPRGTVHLSKTHFNGKPANNQMQERLNGTYKDRTKSMREFKTVGGAGNFSLAFAI